MAESNDILKNADDKYCIAEKRFLEEYVQGQRVTIFLVNGIKLVCEVLDYDDVCLVVTQKDNPKKRQMLYKENIATVAES